MTPASPQAANVPFREGLRVWVKVAIFSFGGPASQIAVMHRLLVEEKRWVSEERFLHALNYTMLLPGPEAQQLAVYIGWLLHGVPGGLVAGTLFVLPGFLSILALSSLYVLWGDLPLAAAALLGLKAAILAIVVEAVLRIGRRVLKNRVLVGVALAAFVAIFFLNVPFPFIVLAAGLLGYVGSKCRPDAFLVPAAAVPQAPQQTELPPSARRTRHSAFQTCKTALLWLAVWLAPLPVLVWLFGSGSVFVAEAVFFSKTAMVTFGGAYAVLAYIAQQAVQVYGWLLPGEMLDGLGMAETTPGPLIQVVQFVGFLGAFRNPGTLDPWLAGLLGSVVTTWFTFAPSFLWIFAGAPHIERLRGRKSLHGALSTITAAIVGVILNLAIWFALHVIFAAVSELEWLGMRLTVPDVRTLNVPALLITAAAFLALLRFQWGMFSTLGFACAAGIVLHYVSGA